MVCLTWTAVTWASCDPCSATSRPLAFKTLTFAEKEKATNHSWVNYDWYMGGKVAAFGTSHTLASGKFV